jgi:hypothetical protein
MTGHATMADLAKRGYTMIIDRSGSMSTRDAVGGKTRWNAAHEGTASLARAIEEISGGKTLDALYVFSSQFQKFPNATATQVDEVFNDRKNDPNGGTNLAAVLKDALDGYFVRKSKGQTEAGEIFVVVTDGEPDDQQAVVNEIVRASKKIDTDEEIGIEFIQMGHDPKAKAFLDYLDNNLTEAGAKFDIVNTVTQEAWEGKSMADVLLASLND